MYTWFSYKFQLSHLTSTVSHNSFKSNIKKLSLQQKLTLLVGVPHRVGLNIERKKRREWRRERKKAQKGEWKECKGLVSQLWLLTTPKKCNWQVRPRRTSGTFQFES